MRIEARGAMTMTMTMTWTSKQCIYIYIYIHIDKTAKRVFFFFAEGAFSFLFTYMYILHRWFDQTMPHFDQVMMANDSSVNHVYLFVCQGEIFYIIE